MKKSFICWIVAYAMILNPLTMAVAKTTGSKTNSKTKVAAVDIKTFLETTKITQKELSLRQYYSHYRQYLGPQAKAQMDSVVRQYGDVMLPKMDVTKVKGPQGQDVYQLQGIKDGESISITLVDDGKTFMKMNGENYSMSDMVVPETIFEKAGVDKEVSKNVPGFGQTSANSKKIQFLSAEQVRKLSKKEKQSYLKQMREVMESVEAVQNLKLGRKTVMTETMFDVVMQALLPAAIAQQGESCFAAGWATQVGHNPQRPGGPGWSCGTDGQGGAPESLRSHRGEVKCTNSKEFLCNPVVYGPNGPCVSVSKSATAECNAKITGQDIPDWANEKQSSADAVGSFNSWKANAERQLAEATEYCAGVNNGSKFSQPNMKGIQEDQLQTCTKLQARLEVVMSWSCENPEFKSKYTKICPSGGGTEPGPGPGPFPPEPGGPVTPVPPMEDPSQVCTDITEPGWSFRRPGCRDGSTLELVCYTRTAEQRPVYSCQAGSAGGVDGGYGGRDRKKAGWFTRNKRWLLPVLGGVVGLGVFYWLHKRSLKEQYRQLEPLPQDPPVPVPTVPPIPTPRPDGVN